MGVHSGGPPDARHRSRADRRHVAAQAPSGAGIVALVVGLTALGAPLAALGATPEATPEACLTAEGADAAPPTGPVRIATLNTGLKRRGPGLLARDIARGEAADVALSVAVIAANDPDILLLTEFDYDMDGVALGLFATRLAQAGVDYAYSFALRPNTGWPTGQDMDGDGRTGGPADAQGFGYFSGQGGMALLSKLPLVTGAARDFSGFLWRDLPGALLSGAGLSAAAAAVQRLSTTGHWDVPVCLGGGRVLHLLAMHATPPVFDGPEDRNGRRNHDEIAFWEMYLDGRLPAGMPAVVGPFVLLGDFNLDPADGDGRRGAMRRLLAHPRVQDTKPGSHGAVEAARIQRGANDTQHGAAALDTADWDDTGPGNMRVDYVLPSAGLLVRASGVFWPAPGEGGYELISGDEGPHHRLVWVDVE